MSIMAEGLRLKELDPRYAYGIAEVIWKKAAEDNLSLSTAYSQILKASTAHIVAVKDEDNWSPLTQSEDRGEDNAQTSDLYVSRNLFHVTHPCAKVTGGDKF